MPSYIVIMRERSTFGRLPLAKDTGRPSRCVLGRDHANPRSLPDDELLRGLREVLKSSRRVEADLIAFIAEVDARRLYLEEGCSSMFAWCLRVLHFEEAVAPATRLAATYPGDGELAERVLSLQRSLSPTCSMMARAASRASSLPASSSGSITFSSAFSDGTR